MKMYSENNLGNRVPIILRPIYDEPVELNTQKINIKLARSIKRQNEFDKRRTY